MVATLTPMEMFDELVRLGYVVPANVDPAGWMMPTAYVSVPTSTAFVTPPINEPHSKAKPDAKLGTRTQRNTKRNKRPKR
jgi:hypothetical protein